jgi:pyridoxine kinase
LQVDPITRGQVAPRRHQSARGRPTGRGHGRPNIIADDAQADLLAGLVASDRLPDYSHIINGFVGSKQLLIQLSLLVRRLKRANPAIQFVCDPIMGDYG